MGNPNTIDVEKVCAMKEKTYCLKLFVGKKSMRTKTNGCSNKNCQS